MPRKQPKLVSIGYDGKFELGITEVADPYEGDTRKTIPVAVNVKHDIVLHMYSRHQIGEHQYRAGNRFLALVQAAEASSGLAIDPTREPVDGSGDSSGIIDSRLRAARELARITDSLGLRGYRIARFMICRDASMYNDPRTQRERDYLHARFREVLTDLAIFFQYMGKTAKVA
jgi:hypothetical protein